MRRAEWPLLIAVFLDLVGFGMLFPDVQLHAEAQGAPGWLIGLILASTFIVQTVVSPYWGGLADRIGARRVFLGCTAISALSLALYGWAAGAWQETGSGTLGLILASRILAGLAAANVAVAQSSATQSADSGERAGALGRLGAALTAGLIAGPAAGGFISAAHGSAALGYVAASCSLAGLIVAWLFARFPEGTSEAKGDRKRSGWPLLAEFSHLRPLVLVSGVAWFSLATLEGTFGRLIKHNLGYGPFEFGIVFSWESLVSVAVQGLILAWLTKRVKEKTLLWTAYLLQGTGLGLMPIAPGLGALLVVGGVYSAGSAIANPIIGSLASRAVPDERHGEMFGLLQSSRAIGFAVGPLLGGALFDWRPAAPYVLAALVCVVSAALVVALVRPGSHEAGGVDVH